MHGCRSGGISRGLLYPISEAPCPAGEFVEILPVWMPEDFGSEAAAIEREQMAQMAQMEAHKWG